MHYIVVCTEDHILAKKVRFLLARDDCEVQILTKPALLEARLTEGGVHLLVLSHTLGGQDAVARLEPLRSNDRLPPTLILGGPAQSSAPPIQVLPDPIDTQAIYQFAARALRPGSASQLPAKEDGPARAGSRRPPPPPPPRETSGAATELHDIPLPEPEPLELEDEILAAEPAAPEISGEISPVQLASALHACWSKDWTGELILERRDEKLRVYFDQGNPIAMASSVPGDSLGCTLVTRSRITDDQYATAAKAAVEKGISLGDALVASEVLTEEELVEERGAHAMSYLVGCFADAGGRYEIHLKAEPRRPAEFSLPVGHLIAEGLRTHAPPELLRKSVEIADDMYFELERPTDALQADYPLSEADVAFLKFEGRAYNVSDAAESAGLTIAEAKTLVAILQICGELTDFTPSVEAFEARIKEERQRTKDLEEQVSRMPGTDGTPSTAPHSVADSEPGPIAPAASEDTVEPAAEDVHLAFSDAPDGPTQASETDALPTPSEASTELASKASSNSVIPLMPAPSEEDAGSMPRPLIYAKPQPTNSDGSPVESAERALSREHFQRGVTLLGQGNFASAEEAFRDAVALCADEHVYLIGLARALFYNPAYRADGKIPLLRSIIARAKNLSPDDGRIATLEQWVDHAERSLHAA